VVSGGADWLVQIWDSARAGTQVIQMSCSLITLATTPANLSGSNLAIAHLGGLSLWSATALSARNR